jgi:hypothetical protein
MTKYVETKYSNKQYNKIEDQVFWNNICLLCLP